MSALPSILPRHLRANQGGRLSVVANPDKIPRASLSISLLGDEDFRVLIGVKGGAEAFGVFVAMLVVGRERLQHSQARQLSGTDSLRFDNSTTHVLTMAYMKPPQLSKAVAVLAEVAKITGNEPWMYLDDSLHLVIRSFFKFNVSTNWGGKRDGSGRPSRLKDEESRGIQDDSQNNHLEKPLSLSLSLSPIPPSSASEPPEQPSTPRPIDPGFLPVANGGPGKNSADATALEVWANELGVSPDGEGYGFWARQTCDYAPAAWIKAVLTRDVLGRTGGGRRTIPYLVKTLGNMLKSGDCPLLVEPGDARPSVGSTSRRNAPMTPEFKAKAIERLNNSRDKP